MTTTILKSSRFAAVATIAIGSLGLATAPALAFNSGDVPAPVDQTDNAGPGSSHTSSSSISGFDGNQGNDKNVGNAGGGRGGGNTGGGNTGGGDTGGDDGSGGDDGGTAPAPQ